MPLFDFCFIPLSLPSFFHIPESRFAVDDSATCGDGGVVGLSFEGLSVLPLSSVIPGPERFCSEPLPGCLEDEAAGEDVDCASRALKRDLVAIGEGADFRYVIDGGE